MTRAKRMRLVLMILLLLLSIFFLCWGFFPLGEGSSLLELSPQELDLPTPGSRLPLFLLLV